MPVIIETQKSANSYYSDNLRFDMLNNFRNIAEKLKLNQMTKGKVGRAEIIILDDKKRKEIRRELLKLTFDTTRQKYPAKN